MSSHILGFALALNDELRLSYHPINSSNDSKASVRPSSALTMSTKIRHPSSMLHCGQHLFKGSGFFTVRFNGDSSSNRAAAAEDYSAYPQDLPFLGNRRTTSAVVCTWTDLLGALLFHRGSIDRHSQQVLRSSLPRNPSTLPWRSDLHPHFTSFTVLFICAILNLSSSVFAPTSSPTSGLGRDHANSRTQTIGGNRAQFQ